MASFLGNVGASYTAGQTGRINDAKIASQQLANVINQLSIKKTQIDSAASNLAGNYAASAPQGGPQIATPQPGQGGGGLPAPPPQGGPQQVPMPGATPMAAPQIPPPPPGGAPPPMGGPGLPRPAPAPQPQQSGQQVPWWRAAAADMKKANPDATGEQIMAAIEKLTPTMSAQTKTDLENFKLHIEQQQKQAQLDEREKNDTAIAGIREQNALTAGRNADTNAARAASYDKSINERNQRALDNIGIKLQAAKAKGPDASKDPAYRALETQYKQVSQDLRAAQALGAQTTPEQTLMLQDKLTALSSKMDMYVNSKGGGSAAPAAAAPDAGGGTVNVISPDGTPGSIPADQWDAASQAGYKKAP